MCLKCCRCVEVYSHNHSHTSYPAEIESRASKGVSHQPRFHAEAIATVSFWANWISPIGLASVVERHHVGIGDEGWFMFVLNLDRGPRKHETVVLGRASVLKGRIVGVATKGAYSNHAAFEDYPVDFFM
jgi:hypothetical protein